jgi:hypothetical protein
MNANVTANAIGGIIIIARTIVLNIIQTTIAHEFGLVQIAKFISFKRISFLM